MPLQLFCEFYVSPGCALTLHPKQDKTRGEAQRTRTKLNYGFDDEQNVHESSRRNNFGEWINYSTKKKLKKQKKIALKIGVTFFVFLCVSRNLIPRGNSTHESGEQSLRPVMKLSRWSTVIKLISANFF